MSVETNMQASVASDSSLSITESNNQVELNIISDSSDSPVPNTRQLSNESSESGAGGTSSSSSSASPSASRDSNTHLLSLDTPESKSRSLSPESGESRPSKSMEPRTSVNTTKPKFDPFGGGAFDFFGEKPPVFEAHFSRGGMIVSSFIYCIAAVFDILAYRSGQAKLWDTRFWISESISAFVFVDSVCRALIGTSPLSWLAMKIALFCHVKPHLLPIGILKAQGLWFTILTLAIATLRFFQLFLPSAILTCSAVFSLQMYGVWYLCPVSLSYGVLVKYGMIKLDPKAYAELENVGQAHVVYTSLGPEVPREKHI